MLFPTTLVGSDPRFAASDTAAIGYGVPPSFFVAFFFSRHLRAGMAGVHRVEGSVTLLAVVVGGAGIYMTLRHRGERALAAAAWPLAPGAAPPNAVGHG